MNTPKSPIGRFLKKIKVSETNSYEGIPCWDWEASLNEGGYGRLLTHEGPYAHQFSYWYFIEPLDDDLEIDHLCRNRACQNPLHLEAVTHAENKRRAKNIKTECIQGHTFTPKTSYYNKKGERTCQTCRDIRTQRRLKRLTSP